MRRNCIIAERWVSGSVCTLEDGGPLCSPRVILHHTPPTSHTNIVLWAKRTSKILIHQNQVSYTHKTSFLVCAFPWLCRMAVTGKMGFQISLLGHNIIGNFDELPPPITNLEIAIVLDIAINLG